MSFADDTRLYHGILNVDDCSFLQNDLNSVYDWASCNNMSFNDEAIKNDPELDHNFSGVLCTHYGEINKIKND